MKTRKCRVFAVSPRPLALALWTLTLAASPALAEPFLMVPWFRSADLSRYDTNYIELGGIYNSQDSFKHGEWSGLTDQGGYAAANFNWLQRDLESARYWDAWGYNLGLDSRRLGGSLGTQGLYGVQVEYQGLPHYVTDSASFMYNGLGGYDLVLPSGFPGINGQPPANSATINAFQRQYDIKQSRDVYKIGGNVFMGSDVEVLGGYRYDKRKGTNLTGLVMGSGGDPREVLLPYPIDDNTQQFDGKVRWNTEKGQIEAGYHYSRYSNSDTPLTWQNAYMTTGSWLAGTGFPSGYGQTSLMPDNHYQQFRLSGGYNIAKATRITGIAAYGMSRQDAGFAPYTINSSAINLNTPLPRDSLDGKIDTTLLNLNLTSRAIDRTSLKARYRYYNYNNKTPVDRYSYVQADTLAQVYVPGGDATEAINSPRIRYNTAQGKRENTLDLEGSYALSMGTSLRGYYTYKRNNYQTVEESYRDNTNDDIYGIELRKQANSLITGWLRYEYMERRGSTFDEQRLYRTVYTWATTQNGYFDNLPTLRQFFIGDYDQNKIKGLVSLTPADTVTLSLSADWSQRKMRGPDCGGSNDQVLSGGYTIDSVCMGRSKADIPSYTIDGQWTPFESLTTYAFYTWSRQTYDQNSRAASNKGSSAADPSNNWGAQLQTTDNTLGVGVHFKPEEKPYDIGAQYVLDYNKSALAMSAGSAQSPVIGVPDATYRYHSAELYASYQWNKNVKMRFNYLYERLKGRDWAYNSDPAVSNNVIGTGMQTADYVNNLFYLTIAYTY